MCLLMYLAQRRRLTRLHRNILNAKEGILEPLDAQIGSRGYLARLVRDYNEMIDILRATFNAVEASQSRVIHERNHSNALLQSLPGALLKVDDSLTIHSLNRQTVELLGIESERLVGRNLFDILKLDESHRELLRDVFLYKRALRNQDIAVDIGGKRRWLSFNLSFLSEHDEDMGAVIVMQDVTDYRQLQQSVAQREKFVAMGQVAAGVAHELNTPLGNILGYVQLLTKKADNAEKRRHYIDVISEEAHRCSRIVTDLLSFARRDRCDGNHCDLNQMVEDVVKSFINCRLRRLHIHIDLVLHPERLMVEGSCGELEIVLTNLLLNAIQALKQTPNPSILIETRNGREDSVSLVVADNGPGVPEELQQRIFEPFFTTKEIGEGSGLGLSTSLVMLEKRGATIKLDPNWSPGARFAIRLPVYVEQAIRKKETCHG